MLGTRIGAAALATGLLAASLPYGARAEPSATGAPHPDAAAHYGVVTPRDVFAIAINFNAVLDYYLETHQPDRAAAIGALVPSVAAGKQPDDVFRRSRELADLVDRLATGAQLPPVLRIDPIGPAALDAEAFLQVGASLDGLIFFLSARDASRAWGDFYATAPSAQEKSADDAFAVVDLAVRKLELATAPPSDDATRPDTPPAASAPGAEPPAAAGA